MSFVLPDPVVNGNQTGIVVDGRLSRGPAVQYGLYRLPHL
jgi:hypothetical protein